MADPRGLSAARLRAVCSLWYLEDGDFCAAERVGNFSSRPASIDAIVESRERHGALPDGIYGNEQWHTITEEASGTGVPVCLAIARSFVRECTKTSADGSSSRLSVLALLGVVAHPSTRRQASTCTRTPPAHRNLISRSAP